MYPNASNFICNVPNDSFVLHDARRQTLIDHSFNVTRVSHDFFRFLKNISNDRVFFLINSVIKFLLASIGMSPYKSIIDLALTQTSP